MSRFLQDAIKEALKGTQNTFYHGAIIYLGGKIISKSCNKTEIFSHAEINAMLRLHNTTCKKKKCGYKLLVVRINNLGQLLNSEPCRMCTKLINLFGIKTVTYSSENGNLITKKSCLLEGNHITKGLRDYESYYLTMKFREIQKKLSLI